MRGERTLARVAIALALLGVLTASLPAQAAARPTRVLLLYGLAPDAPAAASIIEQMRKSIRAELPRPVELYVEYLDLDRFPDPRQSKRLARYLGDKYSGFGIDLMIAAGSVALQFTTELRAELPSTPTVFGMAYAHPGDTIALPTNVTGRLLSVSLGRTLMMARRLQPDLERVFVIAGASAIDSIALSNVLGSIGSMRDSVEVIVRRGVPFDELRAELRQLPPRSVVFFAHFRRDGRGQLFVPQEAIAVLARESPAPSYGYVDALLDRGGVMGGAMLRHNDEAKQIGRLAARVLRAAPGVSLPPVERVDAPFIADWRELRRFKLDERSLPAGTEVRFRVSTSWERYRSVILTTLGIIVAQGVLIGALLLERRARRRAQKTLREQSVHERMMAELTTDAVRHAPEDAPRALEDAVARVAAYAGADAAMLVQYANTPSRPESRVYWMRRGRRTENGVKVSSVDTDAFRLELPLVVAGTKVGALELYRMRPGNDWPSELGVRLVAAAETIAGAIARSSAAAAASEAQRQVAHLGRVAIVGELGSTISHEMRQPLTAMRVNADYATKLLRKPIPDIDEVRQVIQDIVGDAGRATATIEQIRSMLHTHAPVTTAVDLNSVSEHVTSFLRRDAAARGVTLDLELACELPVVMGNAIELQQAILNLALNSLDAVAVVNGPRRVVIGTASANESVEVYVQDTGPGLSPEVRAHLFDPFFTTKEHGLGMGLPIVRTLVEQHGGNVVAENNADGGATVRLILPAALETPNGIDRPDYGSSRSGRAGGLLSMG